MGKKQRLVTDGLVFLRREIKPGCMVAAAVQRDWITNRLKVEKDAKKRQRLRHYLRTINRFSKSKRHDAK